MFKEGDIIENIDYNGGSHIPGEVLVVNCISENYYSCKKIKSERKESMGSSIGIYLSNEEHFRRIDDV